MNVKDNTSDTACGSGGLGASALHDPGSALDGLTGIYSTVDFKVYGFKVLPCTKQYRHAWAMCPFAHKEEKAKRRDVRVYQYVAVACPDMKKGAECPRGELCTYSHNDFEYWLHPQRYKTEMCRDGMNCKRKVCFFAHRLDELRAPSPVTMPPCTSLSAGEMETAGGGLSSELASDPTGLQALPDAGGSGLASSLAGLSEVGTSAASSPASSVVASFSQLSVSAAGPLLTGVPATIATSTAVAAAGGDDGCNVGMAATTAAAAREAGGSACRSTGSPQLLRTGKGSPMPVVTVTGSEEHVVHLHPENAALWERIQQQQQQQQSPPRSGAGMQRGSLLVPPQPPPPTQQARSGSRRGSPVLVQKEQHQQVGEGAFMRAWSPLSPHSAAGGTQQQGASGVGMPRGSPLAPQHQHQQSRPGSSPASPLQIRPATSHVRLGASASAAAVGYLVPSQERAHSLEYILPPSAGLYQQQQELGRQNVVQLQRQGSSPLVGLQPLDQQQQLLLPPLQHQGAQQVMQLPQPSSSLLLMPHGDLYEQPQQPVAYIQQQQQQELLPAVPALSSGTAAAGSSGGWVHTGAVQSQQPQVPLGFDAVASGSMLVAGGVGGVYGVPAMSQSPASLALSGGYVVVHEEPAGQGAFMSLSLSPDQNLEQQQQQGLGYMPVMQGQSLPLGTGPQQLLALLQPPQLQQQQLDQEHAVRMSLAVTQYLAIQPQHGQQLQVLPQPEEIFYYHQQQ